MPEYIIQGQTLTDIADAIRDKTGGSSAMTPAEMVTEIGSIQTGGGGLFPFSLLADFTATDAVSAIRIDFTEAMLQNNVFFIELNGTLSAADWLYWGLNTDTGNNYSAQRVSYSNVKTLIVPAMISNNILDGYNLMIGQNATFIHANTLSYLHCRCYQKTFNTGFNIKVWGCKF